MRELWRTGWMHNRVRMVVRSVPDRRQPLPIIDHGEARARALAALESIGKT
jgi:deoxyribodipyrimidine photolyase